ncbi:unnamed protein product [Nesidiocoris tenuis]|uniref:Uncharacterized protein n=1 Tax=Nesidiocoris tenuis TaxID=355587 RepID=A0A6H5H7Y6_9HEMI|nr:unnamed protein product [Nesidiocoris tenuis]
MSLTFCFIMSLTSISIRSLTFCFIAPPEIALSCTWFSMLNSHPGTYLCII